MKTHRTTLAKQTGVLHVLLSQMTKIRCHWKLILLIMYVRVYTLEVHQA